MRRRRQTRRPRRARRKLTRRLQRGGGAGAAAAAAAAVANPLAIIVEPRKHRALPFVLRNIADNLPPAWEILVLHGTENADWVKEVVASVSRPIRLSSLGIPSLTVAEYNAMLKGPDFYERHVPAETFLLFQVDSMICSPHKDLLEKFLQYDYVGAPWNVGGVGNGGFSLRKRSALLAKLRACPPTPAEAEDGYFAVDCAAVKMRRPTDEAAREFSVETVYSPRSFGVHKPWLHLPADKLAALEGQCPGLAELRRLQ